MSRRFPYWLSLLFVSLLVMSGCAAPPPPPTGAMLMVRVMGREPVEALSLQISEVGKSAPMASVNGIVHSRSVGRWVDFLFPIPLPPGRYGISHENSTLAPFQLNFEVGKSAPTYVGRLVAFQDRSRAPVLEDRYSEDVLMFREVVASLRALDIVAQVGNLSADIQAAPTVAPVSQNVVEVVPASEALLDQIPLAAREPFKRYLRMASPRAFALNDEGLFGVATGKNVVERAIQECSKQGSKRPCKIFSVDQSATVTRPVGVPVMPAPSPAITPQPPMPKPVAPLSVQVPVIAPGPVPAPPRSAPGPQAPSPEAVRPQAPPVSTPACNTPPANPDFKGWLRLVDIVPDAAGSKGAHCAR